jgi:hypothetical protein
MGWEPCLRESTGSSNSTGSGAVDPGQPDVCVSDSCWYGVSGPTPVGPWEATASPRGLSAASDSRNVRGDRTAWVRASADGRSGRLLRTSDSSFSRNLRISAQSSPSCLATFGSLSGPRTASATTSTTSNFAGLSKNMVVRIQGHQDRGRPGTDRPSTQTGIPAAGSSVAGMATIS